MKTRLLKLQSIFFVLILCVGCKPTPETIKESTPIPQGVEILEIIEDEEITNEIPQIKTFDQRESTSPLGAEITFSRSSSKTSERELVLEFSPGVEFGVSEVAKVEIKASLEYHYKEIRDEWQGHQETIKVTVPAGYMQEYTIVWKETRRVGTVRYLENGEEKTAKYNYRIGLELAASAVKDLAQSNPKPEAPDIPSPTPYPTYTTQPTFTPYPTYTPQPTKEQSSYATSTPIPEAGPPALEMGEWLNVDGMRIQIDVYINTLGTLLAIARVRNNMDRGLIFSWVESENFKLYDNTGFVYKFTDGSKGANENIGPGEQESLTVWGSNYSAKWQANRVFDEAVTDIYITVSNLSKLEEATWHLEVK